MKGRTKREGRTLREDKPGDNRWPSLREDKPECIHWPSLPEDKPECNRWPSLPVEGTLVVDQRPSMVECRPLSKSRQMVASMWQRRHQRS